MSHHQQLLQNGKATIGYEARKHKDAIFTESPQKAS